MCGRSCCTACLLGRGGAGRGSDDRLQCPDGDTGKRVEPPVLLQLFQRHLGAAQQFGGCGDQAAVRGKDIVKDMVGRLKRDIMAATNRLDAMRPPS